MTGALSSLRIETRELPSGLRLFAACLPHLRSAALCGQVAIGPHYETRQTHGLSHFLEHMLYRGTQRYPSAHDLVSAIERRGGYLDAMTYCDHGVLSLSSPPESQLELLPIFTEVFRAPLLGEHDEQSIEIERGIVREEINEELDDRGRQVEPENLVRSLCFGKHPLGFSITGNQRSLDRFNSERLRRHHARHYTAQNSVIGVVGPSPTGRMLQALERAFEGLPAGERVTPAPAEPHVSAWRHVPFSASQTSIRLCFRAVSSEHRLEPATQLLLRTLDDGMSTRLYARLSDALGLCYEVSANYEAYRNAGLIDIAADAQHDKLTQVISELLQLLAALRDRGPTQDELELAKQRNAWQLLRLLNSPDDLAQVLGFDLLTQRERSAEPLAHRDAVMRGVTLRQAKQAARVNFDPTRCSLLSVGKLARSDRGAVTDLLRAFGARV